MRGSHRPLSLLIALLSAGLCILCSLWVDAIMRQSQDRHRLIEELEATRAELAAAERQAGTLGERQRLAHEIHDTLAQGVTSVVTLLEATEAELAPGQATARRHLGSCPSHRPGHPRRGPSLRLGAPAARRSTEARWRRHWDGWPRPWPTRRA